MDMTQKDKNLRVVRGNAFALQMEVRAMRPDGSYIDDFRLDADAELYISHGAQRVKKAYELVGNATIIVHFNGTEALGPYDFSMCGTFEGEPWRWSVRKVFSIVELSSECWLPKGTVLIDDTYLVGVTFSLFSAKQQSDWEEKDSTSLAFIRNKPELDDFATKAELEDVAASSYQKPASGIPVSDLSSDIRTSLGKADTALQSFTESDPTVPSWAKQSTKPAYTADEVGALPADTPLFSGNYNDLEDKPTIPVVPANVSAFNNDAGYLTQHQDISGKADKSDTYTKGDVDGLLVNKQDTISDLATIRSGANAGSTAYQKPQYGIPASDIESGVIPTVDYPVTDVRMPNGSSVVNNKVAAIPNIYVHNLVLEGDSTTRIYTTLITLFSNSFDVNSLIAYINNLNYPGGFMCSGTVRTNSSGIATGRTACRLVAGNSSGTIGIIYHDTGDAGTSGPIYYSAGTGANNISNVSDAIVPVLM